MNKADIKIKRVKSPLLREKTKEKCRDRKAENRDQNCFENSVQSLKGYRGE